VLATNGHRQGRWAGPVPALTVNMFAAAANRTNNHYETGTTFY